MLPVSPHIPCFSSILSFIIWERELIVSVASSLWARVFCWALYSQTASVYGTCNVKLFQMKTVGDYSGQSSSGHQK
jgi:hypothetical protein